MVLSSQKLIALGSANNSKKWMSVSMDHIIWDMLTYTLNHLLHFMAFCFTWTGEKKNTDQVCQQSSNKTNKMLNNIKCQTITILVIIFSENIAPIR